MAMKKSIRVPVSDECFELFETLKKDMVNTGTSATNELRKLIYDYFGLPEVEVKRGVEAGTVNEDTP